MRSDIAVRIDRVSKSFASDGVATPVLNNFSLEIPAGQHLSIFGPNGCGKSTLLAIVAGLLEPDSGSVMTSTSNGNSNGIGVVFQNYDRSLLPWRTCLENVALPLEANGSLSRQERLDRADAVLKELDFHLPVKNYPYQMSGGQKQLACIARAMVSRPGLLLLDEPFSSLDYKIRIDLQTKVQQISARDQITTIFVSHELDEAIYVADRVLVFGGKPANILGDIPIVLPRPRTMEVMLSPAFSHFRSEILRLL
jgi:NitT/TauT family transport system ATP-binding protein